MIWIKNLRTGVLVLVLLVSGLAFSGCHASYYKIPITKSRKHFRPYNDKKDRGKKRVHIKKYKSLNRTKKINDQ